MMHGTYVKKI
jgi:hypothetical protein